MNNRLFTTKVNLTKKCQRAEASSLRYVKSGLGGFSWLSVFTLALHLFSTMARRRISLISEEPFNWTSVGIMGSKSKWTQIGQRVNELSGRWNKNRLYLNSSGTLSLQLRLKSASTQKRGSEKPPLSRWAWAKSELGVFFSFCCAHHCIDLHSNWDSSSRGWPGCWLSSAAWREKTVRDSVLISSRGTLPGRLSGSSERSPTGSSS